MDISHLTPEAQALVTGDDDAFDLINDLPDTSATSNFAGKDVEEIVEELQKHPFFMNSLPDDLEDNDMLEAMRTLVYDGEPAEVAANFKNQGNDAFKLGKKGYRDALEFYSKGLAIKANDVKLNAILHVNRAAVNLELKNYRAVLNDCAEALKLEPENVKAFYRAAKACLALGKLEEALDAADCGLKIDPKNQGLKAEKDKIATKLAEEKRKVEDKKKKEREAKMADLRLAQALRQRNLRLQGKPKLEEAKVALDNTTGRLFWPVFFLYPEHKESDFVRAFDEADTLADQLETMFEDPAPWDSKGEYCVDNLELYVDNQKSEGKLWKVPPEKTLGEVLASEGFVIVDGTPSFFVVPKTGEARERFLGRAKGIKDLPMI
jgi:tetratricopeptide (TPR) repeat protein